MSIIIRDLVFPEDISYGATGGGGFFNLIPITTGGYAMSDSRWDQYRPEYTVSHIAQNPEKLEMLENFFYVLGARKCGFLFKDWKDFQVKSGQGVFRQLTSTTFQMYKRYSFGYEYFTGGTVTITGSPGSTSRTATVSGDSPFYPDDASAVVNNASFLFTAGGAQLQITGYTSSTVVTVATPASYVNEVGVAYQKTRVYDHKITKPKVGTVLVTGGSGVVINNDTYRTGIVVASSAPASFTAEFFQPCMFDTDKNQAVISQYNTYDWSNIPIIGVKL